MFTLRKIAVIFLMGFVFSASISESIADDTNNYFLDQIISLAQRYDNTQKKNSLFEQAVSTSLHYCAFAIVYRLVKAGVSYSVIAKILRSLMHDFTAPIGQVTVHSFMQRLLSTNLFIGGVSVISLLGDVFFRCDIDLLQHNLFGLFLITNVGCIASEFTHFTLQTVGM